MRRPAISRFGGLACVALFACWSGKGDPATTPMAASLEPSPRDISGPYWCSIDDAGYEYPRFPCVIKKVGDKLMLAKLGGSQRIRGLVKLDNRDGFTFIGELYCPWGDCTEQMRGRFRPSGKGYKGTLNGPLEHGDEEASMIVHLIPAPANAFGGNGYGGDGYGDPFGYGGAAYGGAGYGGAGYGYYRIDRRGRRRP
jgi:hypothetical protein